MTENRPEHAQIKASPKCTLPSADADRDIMRKVRLICSRGNNAEIKQRKDGSLAVMEVKKNIV